MRGIPPWEQCTSASVLATSSTPDAHNGFSPKAAFQNIMDKVPSGSRTEIVWTHDAVLRFWDFLRSLREAQTLGLLSLSFHASPRTDDSNSIQSIGAGRAPETTSYATDSAYTPIMRTTLLSTDHFKVYHDSNHTMQIRNVLDAWSYERGGDLKAPRGPVKIRMLKGAFLALLNERSKCILTC